MSANPTGQEVQAGEVQAEAEWHWLRRESVLPGRHLPAPPVWGGRTLPRLLTSSQHKGNLGGLAGADAICQGRADAAGLPGVYKAWLSDDTDPPATPATRFTNTATTGPYLLVDGTQIAANFADLTDGVLAAPINVTEAGTSVGLTPVWTNTRANGTAGGEWISGGCNNWTSDASEDRGNRGKAGATDSTWTDEGSLFCSFSNLRLYCFQQA